MPALWIRTIVFIVLVPLTVTFWLPFGILGFDNAVRHPAGWIVIALGAALCLWCMTLFVLRGEGTPNISFARRLAFLVGREPKWLVSSGIYQYSRNPMYLGVLTVLFGEALLCGSLPLLGYSFGVWLFFHLIVLFVEEPFLRRTKGEGYLRYCRETPRWLGRRRASGPEKTEA
jgi:protein-S-isoprenylcysteine O-methyltransferase Ste14